MSAVRDGDVPDQVGVEVQALRPYELSLAGPSLIAASAGTGKTYTIGTLLLRLLLEDDGSGRPAPSIHELLVVTFTTAATAELRQRLRLRLAEALAQLEGRTLVGQDPDFAAWLDGCAGRDPEACRERLRAALRDFDDAAIFTIHGFCQRILREYAFESGVDFDAELVGDESELRRTAIHDYWARMTYHAPALAVAWLQGPGRLDVGALVQLGDALAAAPTLPRVPARADGAPAPDVEDLARLADDLQAVWSAAADEWRRGGPAALALVAQAAADQALNGNRYRVGTIQGRWAQQLAALFAVCPPWVDDETRKVLDRLSADRFVTQKGRLAPKHPFFDACANLMAALESAEAELSAWGMALRHGLDAWLVQELPERKRRAHQQSFDDLLLQLRAALGRGDAQSQRLAGRIRGRFRAALIDEFQDTDQVQYEIFQRVFAPAAGAGPLDGDVARPLLLIGDPKQAIYAFRGADVFAYLQAAAEVGAARSHTLTENHRSDPSLLAALSALWQPVPRPFLFGAIPFIDVTARQVDRLVPALPPLTLAYIPAMVADRAADAKPAAVAPARRAAARAAATAIGRLLAAPPTLLQADGHRELVSAGDVAVLVRTNAQARQMQRVLRDHGIPSVLFSEASVLDQPEVEELRQILAAVVDPAHARRVRAALVTPALGQDAADLDRLAQDEREWEWWIERFRHWQDTWRRAGFLPALRQLLDQCKAPARLLQLTDGERRLTNLLHLAELLHGVAFQLELGPEGLLAWFDRVREDAELRRQVLGDTAQLRLDSDGRAVQIATVHKAKGLEYPIVFCPFLWSGGGRSASSPLRYHDFDGGGQLLAIGPELDDPAKLAQHLEELSENLRLLYVAMTRAKHALWLACGTFNDSASGALAYLLHAVDLRDEAPTDDAASSLEAWRKQVAGAASTALGAAARATDPSQDPVWRRLAALAEANPTHITARYLQTADVPARATPTTGEEQPATMSARRATRPPQRVLHRSSFTALAKGERDVLAADAADGRDLDTLAVTGEPPEPASGAAIDPTLAERVPLADLVAGTRLGTGLHSLLERIDFGTSSYWQSAAEALAARRALPAEAVAPLVEALDTVVHTPLGAGELAFTLADLRRVDRIDELGYVLPVALATEGGRLVPAGGSSSGAGRGAFTVGPADLADILAAHPGGAVPRDYPTRLAALPAPAFTGWLNGALDLVFRRLGADGQPRWYLVDWKSNRLGSTWADYAPERLVAAMVQHHYFLQAHLYTVALQRHLARCQGPNYDYERHFGGVLYVFVRGMRRDRAGSGVLFDRPPAARIAALDELLRRGAAR